MEKNTLSSPMIKIVGLFILCGTIAGTFLLNKPTPHSSENHDEKQMDEFGRHPGWMEQWRMMKEDENGNIPSGMYAKWHDADKAMSHKKEQNTGLVNVQEIGPNNIGGRTRDLIVDMADSKRLLACAISGGLWESPDNGNSWSQVNDLSPNLNVTSITQNPFDHDVFYYGTGEGAGNSSGAPGEGVFKSTDGGKTFTQLESTMNTDFDYIWDIAHSLVDDQTLFVATTNRGLWRSKDGGATFEQVFVASSDVHDFEVFPDGSLMLAVESRGVFKSPSGDVNSFQRLTQGLPNSGFNRLEIEYADSFPDVVYALFAKGTNGYNGTSLGVWKTSNGGDSWTYMGNPVERTGANFGFPWYTLALGVDPVDTQLLVAGSAGFVHSRNGGEDWNTANSGHADHHVYTFRPDKPGYFYLGCDGGVYEYNWETVDRRYVDKNTGYNVTQFYAGSYMPDTLGVIGGTQDNGTNYSIDGRAKFNEVYGGDGAFCHIHQEAPQIAYVSSQNGNLRKTSRVDFPVPQTSRVLNELDANRDGTVDDGAYFIHPFEMNYKNGEELFFPTRRRLWFSFDGAGSWRVITGNRAGFYAVGIPNTAETEKVYVGGDNLQIVRVDDPYNSEPGDEVSLRKNFASGTQGSFISSIVVHPQDDGVIFLALSNFSSASRVWRVDGADTDDPQWTSLGKGLPESLPANSIAVDPNRPDSFFAVATDFGLYTTKDAGNTWIKEERIPNVAIHQLRMRYKDRRLFIYTHGRGIFSADLEDADAVSNVSETNVSGNLTVYPNPSSSQINLEIEGDFNFEIFNVQGSVVMNGSNQRQIDINALPNGTYVIKTDNGKEIAKQSFIKN